MQPDLAKRSPLETVIALIQDAGRGPALGGPSGWSGPQEASQCDGIDRPVVHRAHFRRDDLHDAIRGCSPDDATRVFRFLSNLNEVNALSGCRLHTWEEAIAASCIRTSPSQGDASTPLCFVHDDTAQQRARLVGALILMGDTIDVILDCMCTADDAERRLRADARVKSAMVVHASHLVDGSMSMLPCSLVKLEERRVCAVCHALVSQELQRLRVRLSKKGSVLPRELSLLTMDEAQACRLPPTWWYQLSFDKCTPTVVCALLHHIAQLRAAPVRVRSFPVPTMRGEMTAKSVRRELSASYLPSHRAGWHIRRRMRALFRRERRA